MNNPSRVAEVQPDGQLIVACPGCGKRNRLSPRANRGIYRCAICRGSIPDPFRPGETAVKGRRGLRLSEIVMTLITAAIVFCSVRSCASNNTAPSRPKSQSGRSGLSNPVDLTPIASAVLNQNTAPITAPVLRPARSLPASSTISYSARDGSGVLMVSNGTSRDASVKLVNAKEHTLVAHFYVKAGDVYSIDNLPDGVARLYFAIGTDWESAEKKFTRDVSWSEFDRELRFATDVRHSRTREGVETITTSAKVEVTLHSVIEGNARTSRISQKEFDSFK